MFKTQNLLLRTSQRCLRFASSSSANIMFKPNAIVFDRGEGIIDIKQRFYEWQLSSQTESHNTNTTITAIILITYVDALFQVDLALLYLFPDI